MKRIPLLSTGTRSPWDVSHQAMCPGGNPGATVTASIRLARGASPRPEPTVSCSIFPDGSQMSKTERSCAVWYKKLDIMVILALTWLFTAIGMTLVLGAQLGLRGWVWLCLHYALCLVGAGHELRRGWLRRKGLARK